MKRGPDVDKEDSQERHGPAAQILSAPRQLWKLRPVNSTPGLAPILEVRFKYRTVVCGETILNRCRLHSLRTTPSTFNARYTRAGSEHLGPASTPADTSENSRLQSAGYVALLLGASLVSFVLWKRDIALLAVVPCLALAQQHLFTLKYKHY